MAQTHWNGYPDNSAHTMSYPPGPISAGQLHPNNVGGGSYNQHPSQLHPQAQAQGHDHPARTQPQGTNWPVDRGMPPAEGWTRTHPSSSNNAYAPDNWQQQSPRIGANMAYPASNANNSLGDQYRQNWSQPQVQPSAQQHPPSWNRPLSPRPWPQQSQGAHMSGAVPVWQPASQSNPPNPAWSQHPPPNDSWARNQSGRHPPTQQPPPVWPQSTGHNAWPATQPTIPSSAPAWPQQYQQPQHNGLSEWDQYNHVWRHQQPTQPTHPGRPLIPPPPPPPPPPSQVQEIQQAVAPDQSQGHTGENNITRETRGYKLIRPDPNLDMGLHKKNPTEEGVKYTARETAKLMGQPQGKVRAITKEIRTTLSGKYSFDLNMAFTKHDEDVQGDLVYTVYCEFNQKYGWSHNTCRNLLLHLCQDTGRNHRRSIKQREDAKKAAAAELLAQENRRPGTDRTNMAPPPVPTRPPQIPNNTSAPQRPAPPSPRHPQGSNQAPEPRPYPPQSRADAQPTFPPPQTQQQHHQQQSIHSHSQHQQPGPQQNYTNNNGYNRYDQQQHQQPAPHRSRHPPSPPAEEEQHARHEQPLLQYNPEYGGLQIHRSHLQPQQRRHEQPRQEQPRQPPHVPEQPRQPPLVPEPPMSLTIHPSQQRRIGTPGIRASSPVASSYMPSEPPTPDNRRTKKLSVSIPGLRITQAQCGSKTLKGLHQWLNSNFHFGFSARRDIIIYLPEDWRDRKDFESEFSFSTLETENCFQAMMHEYQFVGIMVGKIEKVQAEWDEDDFVEENIFPFRPQAGDRQVASGGSGSDFTPSSSQASSSGSQVPSPQRHQQSQRISYPPVDLHPSQHSAGGRQGEPSQPGHVPAQGNTQPNGSDTYSGSFSSAGNGGGYSMPVQESQSGRMIAHSHQSPRYPSSPLPWQNWDFQSHGPPPPPNYRIHQHSSVPNQPSGRMGSDTSSMGSQIIVAGTQNNPLKRSTPLDSHSGAYFDEDIAHEEMRRMGAAPSQMRQSMDRDIGYPSKKARMVNPSIAMSTSTQQRKEDVNRYFQQIENPSSASWDGVSMRY